MNSSPTHQVFLLTTLFFLIFLACQEQPAENPESLLPPPDPDMGGIVLPDDFGAVAVVDSLGRGRHLAVNDNGDIYLKLRQLRDGHGMVALRDTSGDGKADLMEGFTDVRGTEVRIRDGYIYYSSDLHVFRQKLVPGELVPEPQVDTLIDFPEESAAGHGSKSFILDGKGNIYVWK